MLDMILKYLAINIMTLSNIKVYFTKYLQQTRIKIIPYH